MPQFPFPLLSGANSWLDANPVLASAILVGIGAALAVAKLHAHHRKVFAFARAWDASGPISSSSSYQDQLLIGLGWLGARFGRNPWSAGSFELCLRLSVVFPILGLYLIWIGTGENASGTPGVFVDVTPAGRVLGLVACCISIYASSRFLISRRLRGLIWLGLAVVAALPAGGLTALAFILATTGAMVISGPFGVGLALGFAFGFAVPMTGFFLVGAMAAALIAYTVQRATHRFGPAPVYAICWVALLAASLAMAYYTNLLAFTPSSTALFVFVAALPLLIAVFGWVSQGVTRALLQQSAEGDRPLLNAAAALAASLILVGLYAVAMTTALQLLNLLAATGGATEPLVDLAVTFTLLSTQPGDPAIWWVYMLLAMPLVPSAIHAFVVSSSLLIPAMGSWSRGPQHDGSNAGPVDHLPSLTRAAWVKTGRRVAEVLLTIVWVGAAIWLLWALDLGLPQAVALLLDVTKAAAEFLGTVE